MPCFMISYWSECINRRVPRVHSFVCHEISSRLTRNWSLQQRLLHDDRVLLCSLFYLETHPHTLTLPGILGRGIAFLMETLINFDLMSLTEDDSG